MIMSFFSTFLTQKANISFHHYDTIWRCVLVMLRDKLYSYIFKKKKKREDKLSY